MKLSICIPVFNWDIKKLIEILDNQISDVSEMELEYEILAVDDASTDISIKESNATLKFPYFRLIQLKQNIGNAAARNLLAEEALYQWLLFLDADMMPLNSDFIQKYLMQREENSCDLISGGIVYPEKTEKKSRLKVLHGKNTEVYNPKKNPYLQIRGNNFLINKETFFAYPFGGLPEKYGYVDTYFGLKLKEAQVPIKIIDNPCIHLGLEDNKKFIEKQKKALRNAKWMYENELYSARDLKIIQGYEKIKKINFDDFFSWLYKKFGFQMEKNLFSDHPRLIVLQLYKLCYFCSLFD